MVYAVQVGEDVPQAVHGCHVPEAETLSDELHGALAGDQDVFVVVLCEHL